jgi:hypothetical protein
MTTAATMTVEGARLTATAGPLRVEAEKMQRAGAVILSSWTDYLSVMTTDLAAGRTPEGLPTAGNGAEGRRLVMTATAMARRGELSHADLVAIWRIYSAAIWADEAAAELAELARAILCTGLAPVTPWPTVTTVVDPTASRPPRGLTEPAASNAPPVCAEFYALPEGVAPD